MEGGNDDIVIEDDLDSANQAGREKKLRERIKEAEAKAKEYLDGWQRAQADFINLRKRDEEARKEFVKFVSLEVVKDLVPALDALALGSNEPVYRLMIQTLGKYGLEEDDPLGEEFDPRKHEAVGTIKSEEENKILEVRQKGYILHGKIIRPAKVKIGELVDSK